MMPPAPPGSGARDRKSTRLNSSHLVISYAVFCLKKKKPHHDLKYLPPANHRRRCAADRAQDPDPVGGPSFVFNDAAPNEIYALSLHDALPISSTAWVGCS